MKDRSTSRTPDTRTTVIADSHDADRVDDHVVIRASLTRADLAEAPSAEQEFFEEYDPDEDEDEVPVTGRRGLSDDSDADLRATRVNERGQAPPNAPASASTASTPRLMGHFRHVDLVGGMVTALIEACRVGVPIDIAQQTQDRNGAPLDRAGRRALESRRTELRDELDRSMEMVRTARDPDQRDDWRRVENGIRSEIRFLETQLGDGRRPSAENASPTEFSVFSVDLFAALNNLAESSTVDLAQAEALAIVVPDFRLTLAKDGQWTAQATLRLDLTDGRVADLGPLTWPVGSGGSGTGLARQRAGEVGREDTLDRPTRQAVHTELKKTGAYSRRSILCLLNSPFPELPYVALSAASDVALPAWVGQQWRSPEFLALVNKTYGSEESIAAWARGGKYVRYSHLRQLVVDLAAEQGDIALADIAHHVRVPDDRAIVRLGRPAGNPGFPPVITPVAETRTKRRAQRRWRSFTCHCGRPASVVARVPEVPRALLCNEGHMLAADMYGLSDTLRFPDAYLDVLRLPFDACVAEVQRHFSRPWKPTQMAANVLEQTDLLKTGCSLRQMRDRLDWPANRVHKALERLTREGYLVREEDPLRWRFPAADGGTDG